MNRVIENTKTFENWSRFTDNSEVWVFQSNAELSNETVDVVANKSKLFCESWQTHGVQLEADAQVVYNRFVVFIVQGGNGPSGCSKDKLTHFMDAIGKELGIDFFDRMSVLYRNSDNVILSVGLHDMGDLVKESKIDKNTIVFNNLVNDKKSLNTNWEIRLEDSWHDNFAY